MEAQQHRVPTWPSGVLSFDGDTLEITVAEERIPREGLRKLAVKGKAGRLSVRVHHQAGLGKHRTGTWVETENGDALRALLEEIESASGVELEWS
jgi:hypothetical protein